MLRSLFISSTRRSIQGCRNWHMYRQFCSADFVQDPPTLYNPFTADKFLQRCLRTSFPNDVYSDISQDLSNFGDRIVSEIDNMGRSAELNLPKLRATDGWGNTVNELKTSQAWKDLHDVSAEEGLISIGYERKHGQWSRIHQFAKLLLFSPSSGLYSCPLAMTDGAAKLIELSDDTLIKKRAFHHLVSRKPSEFWTSGQWMTERQGGSDVGSSTNTKAYHTDREGWYNLSGEKWFSSATDSNMAFTLARIVDSNGQITKGSKGLSLFYLETKKSDGTMNNIKIQRLKNKLGTRQLPTAELLLKGTPSYVVGSRGHGITNISPMLTITRLHNSISATGLMRRILQLCTDYANKRIAFGKLLLKHPLHLQTLSGMEIQSRGCTLITLEVAKRLGEIECHRNSSEPDVLLRYLVSIAKLYTAKQSVAVVSEGLECIGAQGYIEDTGLPGLLRDAQVLPIWEGTTNVLSLDVMKVYTKHKLDVLSEQLMLNLEKAEQWNLSVQANLLKRQLQHINSVGEKALKHDINVLQTAARDFAVSLAHVYIGSLLVKMAVSLNAAESDRTTAIRWCNGFIPLKDFEFYQESPKQDYELVTE